ncbi:MAG: phosphotransferase family protein [Candidatus Omnitrophica bacterium]|nr:hypothetical protein [bacterium]NUN96655.1 phosphotransferase family protein [Candidatus Omnitrophota bacterium]
MTALLDATAPVREGETLDQAALESYLMENLPDLKGALRIEQFPSGHSNLTYLLRVGDRDLVLRRPPFGSKVKSAHDMGREFTVLSALHPIYPPAPKPLLYCEDESVIGAKFYVMERIQGVILRARAPKGWVASSQDAREICLSFVSNLVRMHNLDWESAGLGKMRREGQYTDRQVRGWVERYAGSRTDDIPDIESVSGWLLERIPPDSGAALIHNDYKFDNIVLDPTDLSRIVGVLDWEMTTIGDPLMDLGTTLGYWAEPEDAEDLKVVQCFLTTLPGSLSRMEVAREYERLSGRKLGDLTFYYVFALLKLAVIVQQIYYRYVQGLTRDARFATMIEMVRTLGRKAAGVIETGRIGR